MDRLVEIIVILMLLCSCAATGPEGSDHILGSETTLTVKEVPELSNEYSIALETYSSLLRGNLYFEEGNSKVTVVPLKSTEYMLIDMNNDAIPELALTTAIFQYRHTDMTIWFTPMESAIFTIADGKVVRWYEGASAADFQILSNKAILYEYGDTTQHTYDYAELKDDGSNQYSFTAYKQRLEETMPWAYFLIEYDSSGRILEISEVSEVVWQKTLEPYLSLRSELLVWRNVYEQLGSPQISNE